jgi:hypothetical protein
MKKKRTDCRCAWRPCMFHGILRRSFFLVVLTVSIMACLPFHGDELNLEKASKILEGDEKIVRRAIVSVLREQGYGEVREAPDGSLETDYVAGKDWRTRVVAATRQLGRRKCEVTLMLITEKRTSTAWEPRRIMGKEQYDQFFDVIEFQMYREWSQAE